MAQLVEHNLAKVGVAGSSPVVRSIWAFSSGGERFPDTEEVTSSNLVTPTKCSQLRGFASELFCFTPASHESATTHKAASTTPTITPPKPKTASISLTVIPTEPMPLRHRRQSPRQAPRSSLRLQPSSHQAQNRPNNPSDHPDHARLGPAAASGQTITD